MGRERLKKITDEKRTRYYEKIVYYRCNFCQRHGIFKSEHNMVEHLLLEHKFKLDEEDKIAFLRQYLCSTYLTEKQCLEFGIDFARFKRVR